jgi:hypothetical protein
MCGISEPRPPGLAGAGSPAAFSNSGHATEPGMDYKAQLPGFRPHKRHGSRLAGSQTSYAGLIEKLPLTNAAGRLQTRAMRFSARTAILFFVK